MESLDDGTSNRGEPRLSQVSLRFLGQSGVANTEKQLACQMAKQVVHQANKQLPDAFAHARMRARCRSRKEQEQPTSNRTDPLHRAR